MPSKTFKEMLERRLLVQLTRKFRNTLTQNDCHPRENLDAELIEGQIKTIIDWEASIDPLLDINVAELEAPNALPSPAKRPFVSRKYNVLEAIPDGMQEAFGERVLELYQTDRSTSSSDLGSIDSEQSLSLSEAEKEAAHEHFLLALREERKASDTRVYHTDNRGVRRHDSLTRILSFGARNSVCTAVTVHANRLIVSANSTGELTSEVLSAAILNKLKVLKTFLDFAEETFLYEDERFELEVNRVAALLAAQYGQSGTPDELRQALRKLYRSSQGEPSDLLEIEALLLDTIRFSEALTVLLPSWKKTGNAPQVDEPGLKVYQFAVDTEVVHSEHVHPFDEALQFSGMEKMASFHAEQLLVVYLEGALELDLRTAEGQLTFGISKLTCADCERAMASRQVVTRGASQATFSNVAYITSPGGVTQPGMRPTSHTSAVASPPDSSIKAVEKRERDGDPDFGSLQSILHFEAGSEEKEDARSMHSKKKLRVKGSSDGACRGVGLFPHHESFVSQSTDDDDEDNLAEKIAGPTGFSFGSSGES
ncbi:MAG: hypothetical protein K0U37_08575 [Gammaproteobacteria bacterium]|nr:hypothetical protein [Gammaproteobacteria bacterium]